jgi:hypothetical protein
LQDPLKFNIPGNWARPKVAKFNAAMIPDFAKPPESTRKRHIPSPKLKKIRGAPVADIDQLKHKCLELLEATDSKTLLESSVSDLETKLHQVTSPRDGE